MTSNLFSVSGGLFFPVYLRNYGYQDKGISLMGAQDQTSFITAYNLFNKPETFEAIEMLYSGKVVANKDILYVLCGAGYQETIRNVSESAQEKVEYNKINILKKGETLEFKGEKKGFRTIVFAVDNLEFNSDYRNIERPKKLTEFIQENSKTKIIRVIKGPEFDILEDEAFFNQVWQLSLQSSQMGISLDGESINSRKMQMISQPVADGCIQLSPSGPIVLMRHRQTVGGYPRIATVVEPDIDKLAQMPLGSRVKFKLITLEESFEIIKVYKELLDSICLDRGR
ncbi:hydrolase [Pseudofrancisella aestuarii]|uniref:Hydrolase n=1 Tax=Pseudofrancisella aestuarii TaxID=2670347 RepID=A0ABV9TES9_9GAMM|nr:hydrolase [Pseudofrancisella aestuarii]